tara:strand:- start:107 stop:529 length:423 start_codon:yes stop_codon:yes gene_type:complete
MTEPDVEEIFDKKPKKKRVLTEKQKEALAKGRAKVKENKLKKKGVEESSVELKKEQREIKKQLTKRQAAALEKVRETENKNKKLEEWDILKNEALSKMPDERSFNIMNSYLDLIPEEDLLSNHKIKGRLAHMAKHLTARS